MMRGIPFLTPSRRNQKMLRINLSKSFTKEGSAGGTINHRKSVGAAWGGLITAQNTKTNPQFLP